MDIDREANTRYVASSLEVLFVHPGVVSLTGGDAQGNVRTRPKEKTGKKHDWDTLAFNPDDIRYSCSSVACLQRSACPWRMKVDIYRSLPKSKSTPKDFVPAPSPFIHFSEQ
ncbi:hypothetical protein ACFXTO_003621 [Malus domestica]